MFLKLIPEELFDYEKIIIFGCGKIGHEALVFLGCENIYCFCDNNLLLGGTEKYGKLIITFEELKKDFIDAIVVIATADHNAYVIARQCEENGVFDYLIYTFIREQYPSLDRTKLLDFISDTLNRTELRKDMYLLKTEKLEKQIQYFRKHADIQHMKPAKGKLRLRQERSVQASSEFFEKIRELQIKPILYGGNLLGHVRHNGFIPWDDDIDFALIREDYEKLKGYCKLHIYSEREYGQTKCTEKNVLLEMKRYSWALRHDHLHIGVRLEDGYYIGMDFFVLEYYADYYSMEKLRGLLGKLKEDLILLESEEEKIQYIDKARERNIKNTPRESSHIYFGVDNMDMWSNYQRGYFIPKNVVFPLKKVMWEGAYFWVPNNAEKFLTYEYENPWDFPNDIGLPSHYMINEEDL